MKLSLSEQGWNRLFLILNGVFLFFTNANYTLMDSLNYYDIHPLYHEQFEQLQTNYKCCGSSMFTDYRRTNNSLPASCKNNETIYTVGCAEVLNNYTYKYIDPILALCFIFTIIKIIYILISIWMIRRSSTGKDPHILECC
ncbi:tetraspanin 12, variant 3 [Schistosoma haematobium]|uniref:Tetraspanin 12, variant 3 n=1 Tax=Schistosoma haematobium TaxID=6185 RepID=A0A922LZX8_SCHHA|nr:tetraspanin 12, variant 3 [Schistosoma haematobium]KAH9596888.1 tetraspanin 12, variant 3 [Schistosoma haematobium]